MVGSLFRGGSGPKENKLEVVSEIGDRRGTSPKTDDGGERTKVGTVQ